MNKNFEGDLHKANIFVRYLKQRFGWQYESTHPKEQFMPDVDVVLVSKEGRENLPTQITEARAWKETFGKEPGRRGVPIFRLNLISESIVKKEEKYKRQEADTANLILLIYEAIDPDLIRYDVDATKHQNSSFRGIYVVSPLLVRSKRHESQRKQDEMVFVIKDAF